MYLATDTTDPVLIQPIRDHVDIVVTLADLSEEQVNILLHGTQQWIGGNQDDALSRVLDAIPRNANDDGSLVSRRDGDGKVNGRILIPFLDQMVTARGCAVIGTQWSTFSSIVERLHRSYWNDPLRNMTKV